MALSNSQYDELMRTYEQRQLDNEHALRKRYETACSMIPELPALDNAISSSSIKQARLLLDGHEDALSELKKEISRLSAQKQALLCSHGFPEDYLELHYLCPDCKDTGYIGTNKCHCFKKAIVDLLYTQSNLQEILEKENFSTFSLDYYSSNHKDPLTGRSSLEAIQTALHICHEFVDTFSEDFRNILLYGDTGVGKTFLSHCIAKEVMDSSYSVIYFSASRLFDVLAKICLEKRMRKRTTLWTIFIIVICSLLMTWELSLPILLLHHSFFPVSTSVSFAGNRPSFQQIWHLTILKLFIQNVSSHGSAATILCSGSPEMIFASKKNY